MPDIFDTIKSPSQETQGDIFDQLPSAPQQDAPVMSKIARFLMSGSPIEQFKTASHMYANKETMPKIEPGEDPTKYKDRVQAWLQPREEQIAKQGTMSQFALPMEAALAISGGAAPLQTAKTVGKFMALDKATNMVPFLNPENIKDPNLRDTAEIVKFGAEGALAGRQWIPKKSPEAILSDVANTHRQILNPGKGIIKKVEIKSGKDINDLTRLAAESKLIYGKDEAGKLDTTGAIKQVEDIVSPKYDQINEILSQDKRNQFDLKELATRTKRQLSEKYTNAKELAEARNKVDAEIAAEIERHGQLVDGTTLNTIKRGMWSKSYNPLEPNANNVARQIGYNAKDIIEEAYPNEDVRGLNQDIGKYLDLRNLLEASHGNVVQAGKLGKYAAQIVGAAAGSNIPLVGPLAGGWAGGKVSEFLNNPERISSGLAKKVEGLDLPIKARATVVSQPKPVPQAPLGLPDKSLSPFARERAETPYNPMQAPSGQAESFNPINMGGYVPPKLNAPEKLLPKYLEERGNIPPIASGRESIEYSNAIPMKGEVILGLPSPSTVSPKTHEIIPVSNQGRGKGFIFGGNNPVREPSKMFLNNFKNMTNGNIQSAHIGNIPVDIANQKWIPQKIFIDQKIVDKLKEKHNIDINNEFIESINKPDFLMFSKEEPGKINIAKKLDNGEYLVVGTRQFKGHFVITGFTSKKLGYLDNVKDRGDVMDVAGGTPFSPIANAPEGTRRQPERLSGVSNKKSISKKK